MRKLSCDDVLILVLAMRMARHKDVRSALRDPISFLYRWEPHDCEVRGVFRFLEQVFDPRELPTVGEFQCYAKGRGEGR